MPASWRSSLLESTSKPLPDETQKSLLSRPRQHIPVVHGRRFKRGTKHLGVNPARHLRARGEQDFPTTSEFVITPAMPHMFHKISTSSWIFAWPKCLKDDRVALALEASSIREQGVVLIFDLYHTFMVSDDQGFVPPNVAVGLAIRIFDTCLASSVLDFPASRAPMVAAASLMIATKFVEVPSISKCCAVCSLQSRKSLLFQSGLNISANVADS